ncbi:MAG: phage integrase family protein [Acidobacteria bacterium]|nr:phage integrase family protein [Acidobacteriota bacterium]
MPLSDGWGANKGRKFPVEVLTPEEVASLIGACSKRGSAGIRDAALIGALYYGGLRLNEALQLYPRDVDLEKGTVNVRIGKGSRQRLVALVGDAGGLLIQRWLDRRAQLGLTGRHRLFCTLKGSEIQQTNVRGTLQRLRDRAGIEKRVHPHGLRHSHAYNLCMDHGVPVTAISGQLGHSDVGTTSRYLDHLAPEARVSLLRSLK